MIPARLALQILTLSAAISFLFGLRAPGFAQETIRLGGAGTGLGVMKLLGTAFEKANPGVSVQIMPNLGSSGGIMAVSQGRLDLAVSGRPLRKNELSPGITAKEIARSPFVFVANRDVATHGVTIGQLEQIYDGRLQVWPDNRRVRLIVRPDTDTDTAIVRSISPALDHAVQAVQKRKGMLFAVTDQQCVEMVSKTPGGLGGSTLSQVITEQWPVKTLDLDGVRPSLQALKNGTYRVHKPIYLVSSPATSKLALRFAAFIESKEATAILERGGMSVTGTAKGY